MNKKIVIASKNPGKIKEFNEFLIPLNFEILCRSDLGFIDEIEETSNSFEGNAKIKAKACFDKLKIPTIADDSGLEVDALNGKPGVFSARYASVNNQPCTNEQNIAKILDEMKNKTNRDARMICALCFINQYGKIFTIIETCSGQIAEKPTELNGFGFDYIFSINGKMLSEFSTAEKNKISHRGKALSKLKNNIQLWWDSK